MDNISCGQSCIKIDIYNIHKREENTKVKVRKASTHWPVLQQTLQNPLSSIHPYILVHKYTIRVTYNSTLTLLSCLHPFTSVFRLSVILSLFILNPTSTQRLYMYIYNNNNNNTDNSFRAGLPGITQMHRMIHHAIFVVAFLFFFISIYYL